MDRWNMDGNPSYQAEKTKRSEDETGLDSLIQEQPKRGLFRLGDDGQITACYSPNEQGADDADALNAPTRTGWRKS